MIIDVYPPPSENINALDVDPVSCSTLPYELGRVPKHNIHKMWKIKTMEYIDGRPHQRWFLANTPPVDNRGHLIPSTIIYPVLMKCCDRELIQGDVIASLAGIEQLTTPASSKYSRDIISTNNIMLLYLNQCCLTHANTLLDPDLINTPEDRRINSYLMATRQSNFTEWSISTIPIFLLRLDYLMRRGEIDQPQILNIYNDLLEDMSNEALIFPVHVPYDRLTIATKSGKIPLSYLMGTKNINICHPYFKTDNTNHCEDILGCHVLTESRVVESFINNLVSIISLQLDAFDLIIDFNDNNRDQLIRGTIISAESKAKISLKQAEYSQVPSLCDIYHCSDIFKQYVWSIGRTFTEELGVGISSIRLTKRPDEIMRIKIKTYDHNYLSIYIDLFRVVLNSSISSSRGEDASHWEHHILTTMEHAIGDHNFTELSYNPWC